MVVTNYTLCSKESKPNQNKNEQTPPPPPPREQHEGMQEVLQSIRIPRAHSMAFLIWRCVQLCYLSAGSIWYLWPDKDPETAKLPSNLCLNTTSFPSFPSPGLESVSSMKEVLFVTVRKAWHQVSWILISRPLKPLCVHPRSVEVGVKAALMGPEGKKKAKPNKTTQVHLFLNKRRNWGTAWPQENAPVRRWWLGTTVAESGCQHLLNASSWVFSGPCTCPHRDERWPQACGHALCLGAPEESSGCLLLPENGDQNNTWHTHWKEHWC